MVGPTKDRGVSRRRFLKAAAAGALTVGSGPMIFAPRRAEAYQAAARVHPNIDPLRVVGLT
ncbi:MAG: twin-arginine translocation signal domain-containing protein, partial [Planctomycetota bacterium]